MNRDWLVLLAVSLVGSACAAPYTEALPAPRDDAEDTSTDPTEPEVDVDVAEAAPLPSSPLVTPCMVRDVYIAAEPSFVPITSVGLPSAVAAHVGEATYVARLESAEIGEVYILPTADGTKVVDAKGALMLFTKIGAVRTWLASDGSPLVCNAEPPFCGERAVDASAFPYTPSRPRQVGACTATEIAALTAHYRANAPRLSIGAWRATVSAACGSCAFGGNRESFAAPILTNGDTVSMMNLPGCYEIVSGRAECGRRFSQLQQCMAKACRGCETIEQREACVVDRKVAEGACSAAMKLRDAACSDAPDIAARCASTNPVFVGPVSELCGG